MTKMSNRTSSCFEHRLSDRGLVLSLPRSDAETNDQLATIDGTRVIKANDTDSVWNNPCVDDETVKGSDFAVSASVMLSGLIMLAALFVSRRRCR